LLRLTLECHGRTCSGHFDRVRALVEIAGTLRAFTPVCAGYRPSMTLEFIESRSKGHS